MEIIVETKKGPIIVSEEERLELKKIIIDRSSLNKNGCLEWTGSLEKNGYARFFHKNIRWHAHRAAFVCEYGSIPAFTMICHTCDNRKCVNHEHIYAGSHTDNVRDMVQRDRLSRGQKHSLTMKGKIKKGNDCHFSVLNSNKVIMIRELYKIFPNCCYLSRLLDINRKTIDDIINKKSWGHLDENN